MPALGRVHPHLDEPTILQVQERGEPDPGREDGPQDRQHVLVQLEVQRTAPDDGALPSAGVDVHDGIVRGQGDVACRAGGDLGDPGQDASDGRQLRDRGAVQVVACPRREVEDADDLASDGSQRERHAVVVPGGLEDVAEMARGAELVDVVLDPQRRVAGKDELPVGRGEEGSAEVVGDGGRVADTRDGLPVDVPGAATHRGRGVDLARSGAGLVGEALEQVGQSPRRVVGGVERGEVHDEVEQVVVVVRGVGSDCRRSEGRWVQNCHESAKGPAENVRFRMIQRSARVGQQVEGQVPEARKLMRHHIERSLGSSRAMIWQQAA